MAKAQDVESGSVVAPIGYIASLPKNDQEIPYYLLDVEESPDVPATNIELVSKECKIKDMRTQKPPMSLERDAFQLFNWPYPAIGIESDLNQVKVYCKEMVDLLAKELGAQKVFCFDFRVRDMPLFFFPKEKQLQNRR
jgi:hypothetical protein